MGGCSDSLPMILLPLLALRLISPSTSPVLPEPKPLQLIRPLQDKNFYFLSLIQRDARVRLVLGSDSTLGSLASDKSDVLKGLFAKLDFGKISALSDLAFTQAEEDAASARLEELAHAGKLDSLIEALRKSGAEQRYAGLSDSKLIVQAWRDAAEGMNRIINVYGTAELAARSESIDSPIYTPKMEVYGGLLKTVCGVAAESMPTKPLFFEPTLDISVRLLTAQVREEASRHEPLELGENRLAYRHVAKVDFGKFPYSSMLVPGFGPEESQVRLSPIGGLALELAATRYRRGLAPFIIVSGGYVHPNRTPYSEAIEMKRSLISDYGVPAEAIIVDPHARHTTTNIRNAARLIFRYGIPFEKEALIVTNSYQSRDIESAAFERRCQSVFGYQPGTHYRRKSEFDLAYLPSLTSLTIDPSDPLDP